MDGLPPGPARVLGRLLDRRVVLVASSLAFYGLISALPLLLVSLTAAEWVLGPDAVRRLAQQATRTDARGVAQILLDVGGGTGGPAWWAYLFVLWPATAYGGGLRRAFMEAHGDEETLPALKGRAIGLLLVLILPLVVLGGIPVAFVLTRLWEGGLVGTFAGLGVGLLGGVVAGTLLNAVLYQAFTSEDLGWARTLPTAAVVATATSLMSVGFVEYVRLATLEQRYGSATLAMVLLFGVWLFAVNVLLLAGYHAILEYQRADGADD